MTRVARMAPGRTALVDGERRVSYGELDALSEVASGHLHELGVRPGEFVPIVLPRGADLVIAVLAVLKRGGVYSLLPPDWPKSRQELVLQQLNGRAVIAGPAATEEFAWPVLTPEDLARPAAHPPVVRVEGSDPCCVFFTSGTTGLPRGAVSPHRATARLFGRNSFIPPDRHIVIPLAAALPWDAFSLELWAGLGSGGTCVIVEEPFLTPDVLREGISRHGVNTAWATSSLFTMIVEEDLDAMAGLDLVLTGGERLSVPHVERFLRRWPDTTLINGYGPVESTVFATTHRVIIEDCRRPGGIPLGRPVPGTEVFVLDGDRECAVGDSGEICIAGAGLASSYLADSELTAEKFRTIELRSEMARVFRTGDFGRWATDSVLEYLGRRDRQLKIAGVRVEPADIERKIEKELDSVASCRVVGEPGKAGRPARLLAFCRPRRDGDPLREAIGVLRGRLAPFEVPAVVKSVAAFPLTGRGKLDERALLSELDEPRTRTPQIFPDHRGPEDLESLVSRIVAEVLERSPVASDCSLFELGLTSLSAARVCARVGTRLGMSVPMTVLLDHPDVGSFAAALRRLEPGQGEGTLPPPGESAVTRLSPMQTVLLTRDAVEPRNRTNHCLVVWRVRGAVDLDRLERAVGAVHAAHRSLRAAFVLDPRPGMHVTDIPAPPVEVLGDCEDEQSALDALRKLLGQPLEPAGADVWRVAAVRFADRNWILGVVVHHVAFDGWSEGVLADDLSEAYANGTEPTVEPAGPEPVRARHGVGDAHDRTVADLLAEAVSELRGVPELRWPESGAGPAGEPGHQVKTLSAWHVSQIDDVARRHAVTRFVVLLAGWARAMVDLTGQDDFAVGVPMVDRRLPELEKMIGCYITMLPLRFRGVALHGGSEGIRAVAGLVRAAMARSQVPFPRLAEQLHSVGSRRPPVFQTLFALQDNPEPRLDIAGAQVDFLRQSYLDLPLELHVELWPSQNGDLVVSASYRREAVSSATASGFVDRMTDVLARVGSWA
ncbi:AMP-binding protein [Amycolatopsis sp. NPDC051102]|uniref:AMP-binding protein n=1 Tax=Amycolatopsis sp. NPDC051102 TaxID=3155163 RepID=UPI00342CAC90